MKFKVAVGLMAWVAFIFCAGSVGAEDTKNKKKASSESHFLVNLDSVNFGVSGNDVKVGDTARYKEDLKFTDGFYYSPTQNNYGVKYEPLTTAMHNRRVVLWEVGYGNDRRSFKVRGWRFGTSGALNGEIISNKSDSSVGMVRLWDQTLPPLINQSEKSNFSPVNYWANNGLKVRKVDFIFSNRISRKLDLLAGVSSVGLKNDRNEGQSQETVLYKNFWPYDLFHNNVRLESFSSSGYSGWGPLLGLKGELPVTKRLEVGLNLSQSILIGKSTQKGNWIDTDNILFESYDMSTVVYPRTVRVDYRGEFPFGLKQKEVIVNTEAQVKLSYNLTKNLSVGASLLASYWNNVSIAPSWFVPGEWTAIAGSGWKLNKTNLMFYGYSLSVGLVF